MDEDRGVRLLRLHEADGRGAAATAGRAGGGREGGGGGGNGNGGRFGGRGRGRRGTEAAATSEGESFQQPGTSQVIPRCAFFFLQGVQRIQGDSSALRPGFG